MGSPPMGCAPAVLGRFLKPGGRWTAAAARSPGIDLKRFEDAKSLMRKLLPVARRVLGGGHDITIRMSRTYAMAIYRDAGATLDDLREAVTTLQDAERTARRVLGGRHPSTVEIGQSLQIARAFLRVRETRA